MDTQSSNRPSPDAQAPVSIRVIEAVAAREGIDPLEVSPPLHDVLDPTALDDLFEPTGASQRPNGTVSFTYRGHEIRVESDGRVALEGDPETEKDSGSQQETKSR
ncbi:HalOD1 output domain-containing protein [Natrinema amylolyticum]|uniref:HalOD1 output domain-containing protein n=1 Tax=Natrinema amylolyticum TaxID=2878679 RepID=UPI001CFAFF24|nr:HalOD1 output domain-containing protein [Natrinema amylolyticum]